MSRYLIICMLLLPLIALSEIARFPLPPRYTPYLAHIDLPKPSIKGVKKLSLEEAILLAIRFSPAAQNAKLDRIVQKFSVEVAKNQFQLRYRLGGQMTFQNGDSPLYTVNPGLSLKTPFGTEIRTDLHSNTGAGGSNTTGTLDIKQPLLRGFGPAVNLIGLQNAKDNDHIGQLALKNTLITLITQVIQSYYQVVQGYNELKVQELALKQSRANLKQIEEKIKYGKMAPAQAVQQKSQIASQELAVAEQENRIKQLYQQLLVLMGLSPQSQLVLDRNIDLTRFKMPSVKKGVRLAFENNVAYNIQQINLKQTKRSLLQARNEQLPGLDLEATATERLAGRGNSPELQGTGTPVVPVGGNKTMTINVDIPIDDVDRQSKLVDAKIAMQKARVDLQNKQRELETQVINAVRNLRSQLQRIKLAKAAVDLAEKDYKNVSMAWRYGRMTLFEVTTKRTTLEDARIAYINQKIAYISTLAAYHATLGTTLDVWKIKLEQHDTV